MRGTVGTLAVWCLWLLCGVNWMQLAAAKEVKFVPTVTKVKDDDSFNIMPFDDSTVLLRLSSDKVVISRDNGVSWSGIGGVKGPVVAMRVDEQYPKTRASIFTVDGGVHLTDDIGKTWRHSKLQLEDGMGIYNCVLYSHPESKDYMQMNCNVCEKSDKSPSKSQHFRSSLKNCRRETFASRDKGKTFKEVRLNNHNELVKDTITSDVECQFAKNYKDSPMDVADSTILCYLEVIKREENIQKFPVAFFYTTDFGKTTTPVSFFKDMIVTSFEILKSYIVVITQGDKYNQFSPKRIWISTDAVDFKEAYLPTNLRNIVPQTITEDLQGRIICPIKSMDPKDAEDPNSTITGNTASEIFVSDSSGLKFHVLDWFSDADAGFAAMQQLEFLRGTSILKYFSSLSGRGRKNHNKEGKKGKGKFKRKVVTKITTDNGITWKNLRVIDPNSDDDYPCDITNVENCSLKSFIFSDELADPAAGIMMMIGSVSDGSVISLEDQATFLTRDGGDTWRKVFDFPVAYVMGDYGNVIMAVPFDPEEDGDLQSEIYYSLDQGYTWNEYELPESFFPIELLSVTRDGSGLHFMLNGASFRMDSDSTFNLVYSIDFSSAFDGRKCMDDDFESWDLNNGKCISGAKYSYKRRKQDAECLVGSTFKDLQLIEEECQQCDESDYECAFEFSRDKNGNCVPDYNLLKLSEVCSNKKGTVSLKPMKHLKSDRCKNPMDIELVQVECPGSTDPAKGGDLVVATENKYDNKIRFYQYFDSSTEESIIIVDEYGVAYISHDGGIIMKHLDTNDERIQEVIFNPHFNDSAYLFGTNGNLFMTHDSGYSFSATELPESMQLGFPLDFHAHDKGKFIYYGATNCDSIYSPDCHAVAFITHDGGETFQEMLANTIHCEFSGSHYEHPYNKNMVICQVRDKKSQKIMLVSSTDYFKNDKHIIFDDIIGYMSSEGFSVVAVNHDNQELRALVTLDGHEFAEVKLPQELEGMKQETFTVLGAEMGSIFMHMSTNTEPDHSYGDLMKSNSNGTSFVTLQKAVNRNDIGIVDFEKIQRLEGIILINVVDNPDDVKNNDKDKILRSKITFNDGSDWSYLTAPQKDSEGKKYRCNTKKPEECSLNIHGFTEGIDGRDTYSSGSALGMMFALGNVGDSLLPKDKCSTFLTVDGGKTWKEVRKGPSHWEYGDQGGILVLVPSMDLTNTLSYSLDNGLNWNEFQFTEDKVVIADLVTVPRDSALRFLLIAASTSITGESGRTFAIDFSNSFERQCKFGSEGKDSDDFKYVSLQPDCLFGHKSEFLKKVNSHCYVGQVPLFSYTRIIENCTCGRQDFECDYNYQRVKDGTCKLIDGLTPQPAINVCKLDPELVEYYEPTGYRKIPLSTCQGGLRLDESSDKFACPGKEKEFRERYSVSGHFFFSTFFIFFLLFIIFGWVIYDRGVRRNGGFARFGEIRLGEDDQLIENNTMDKFVNSILKGGLVLFSGIYAGVHLSSRAITAFFRRASERFGGRRNPSYTSLMNDQFLDEADDLLAGHDEDANDLSSFMDHENNFDIDDDDESVPAGLNGESVSSRNEAEETTNFAAPRSVPSEEPELKKTTGAGSNSLVAPGEAQNFSKDTDNTEAPK
ncbi:type I sorting receptor KNAG_0G01440 [Huiozyma naganishii CBS 8797]|uniref:VPS10 domain-containing protein n=1 Tax=Huiozyma naganishii (strain ATCC MYA-139 / BCRC 22969 / CBS 8797 / KCTC 17520 / NBRC 10181 / NCYC 3082 / Yp74L-3) TaxID=1071383 RepID=J7S0X4_HUIN7|nr:hypothetical protein KNAG_0G01440 [Kazachstania naganishii CBS 8797]CCK71202.1 hypothetical protein KNAG_0G01440 [Kazachstania naganishii CBS 8797]